jgi:hypothetical protein
LGHDSDILVSWNLELVYRQYLNPKRRKGEREREKLKERERERERERGN